MLHRKLTSISSTDSPGDSPICQNGPGDGGGIFTCGCDCGFNDTGENVDRPTNCITLCGRRDWDDPDWGPHVGESAVFAQAVMGQSRRESSVFFSQTHGNAAIHEIGLEWVKDKTVGLIFGIIG